MKTVTDQCDVLIVGAGPVGLLTAYLLARRGADVMLVERNPSTSELPRAVLIDDEALRIFDGAGLLPRVRPILLEGYGARYYLGSGRCVAQVPARASRFGYYLRNGFHQPELERVLHAALDTETGARIQFSTELQNAELREDGVIAQLRGGSEERLVEARWLLGCDGGSSTVRKLLGIGMEGSFEPDPWLVVDLASDPDDARFTRFVCGGPRPMVSVPGPRGRRRYEFRLDPGERVEEANLWPLVQKLVGPLRRLHEEDLVRAAIYNFHARIAARFRLRSAFLLGDAAHLMPPFAGQGMNSGIRDAANLSWKLAMVLGGQAGDALLDSYDEERRTAVRGMVRLSQGLGRMVMTTGYFSGPLRDGVLRAMAAVPPVRRWFAEMRFKPEPRYRSGFVVTAGSHPALGTMLPQPRVRLASGETQQLDRLLGSDFALLGSRGTLARLDLDSSALTGLSPTIVGLCTDESTPQPREGAIEVGDLDGFLEAVVRRREDELLLVRPDRFVLAAFQPEQLDSVSEQVASLAGCTAATSSPRQPASRSSSR